jgi:hypothetical protein
LVEEGKVIYWPRTGEQFAEAAYAMARVKATLAPPPLSASWPSSATRSLP